MKHGFPTECEKESNDLEKVEMIYFNLVRKTLQSLKVHEIDSTQLKELITTYVKSKSLAKLFSEQKTLDKMFLAFRDYWSFFDYEILSLIISTFCNELEEEKNEYISTFNKFCKRKVSEVPTNFISILSEKHYSISVIIVREFNSVTMTELKELEIKLRKITKIDLRLLRSKDGNLVIAFVSLNEEEEMFPLSKKEKSKLFEMGVHKLYSDNCVFFDYNEYQRSSNKLLSMDYTLKEDWTTSGTVPGSHPILESNLQTTLSRHSHEGKYK